MSMAGAARGEVPQYSQEYVPQSFKDRAAAIGVDVLSPVDLYTRRGQYLRQIQVGLNRPEGEDPERDGGFLCERALVEAPTLADLEATESRMTVSIAVVGGSNLKAGVAEWKGSGGEPIQGYDQVTDELPHLERGFTFDEFVENIGRLIVKARRASDEPGDGLYIAAGYPLKTVIREDGVVDGEITQENVAKGVVIRDLRQREDRRFLSAVMEYVNGHPDNPKRVTDGAVFNDTVAVAFDVYGGYAGEDIRTLPAGMVAGTGTNIATTDSEGQMRNIEIAKMPISDIDRVMTRMVVNYPDFLPQAISEAFTGRFTAFRLAEAVRQLGDDGFILNGDAIGRKIAEQNADFVSQLAFGNLSMSAIRAQEVLGVHITQANIQRIRHLASTIMARAGQEYGVMAAATASAMPLEPGKVYAMPTTGTFFHRGFVNQEMTVREVAEVTAAELGKRLVFPEASDARGTAIYGLVREGRKDPNDRVGRIIISL